MIGLFSAILSGVFVMQAGAAIEKKSTPASKCLSVAISNRDGTKSSFVSFAVSGSPEQLAAIRAAALAIGALAEPPKVLEGDAMLFVFFTSDVESKNAIELYNDVSRGKYHPGVERSAYRLNTMILPIETRKNCPK